MATTENIRKDNRARTRAKTRLTDMYPKTFRSLLDEEREKEGLPPVGQARVGRPPKPIEYP